MDFEHIHYYTIVTLNFVCEHLNLWYSCLYKPMKK